MLDCDKDFKREYGLYYLYVITKKCKNISDQKYYIGVSHNPERRWNQHIKSKGSSYITKAIKKYGIEKFSFRVVASSKIEKDILNLEEYWIDKLILDNFKLYNKVRGGKGKMFASPEERRNKSIAALKMDPEIKKERAKKSAEARVGVVMSLKQRINYAESKMGNKNPMYGKKRTDEEKEMFRQKSINAYVKRKSIDVLNKPDEALPIEVLCFYKFYSDKKFIKEDIAKMTGFSISNVKKIKNRYTNRYIMDDEINEYYLKNKCALDLKINALESKEGINLIKRENINPRGKDQKLTENQVREIRDKYKNKKGSFRSLAKEYNVGKTTIEQIVTFQKWKDLV